jgi:hypothetical protein
MFYIISYSFLMLRVFAFDWNLGYGLGDLVYIAFFTIVFVLATVALFLSKVTSTIWLTWGIVLVNLSSATYIWLLIYVFYGAEVS